MLMKQTVSMVFLFFLFCQAQADIIVIANKNSSFSLSFSQVHDIFMGRNRALSNGHTVSPLDQAQLRTAFYEKITKRPIEDVDAYWLKIQASKQSLPATLLPDDASVLDTVRKNEDAIGYIDGQSRDDSVRILLMLN